MDRNSTLNADVECGGTQVVAHAGLHALGRFADRVGLGPALSSAIPWLGERAPERDRGVVLTHAMLMLAAGGEACSDIEFFASQSRLFGPVASDSTLYRTIRNITPTVLTDLVTAVASVRAGMWRRMGATSVTAMVVLDIDASLIQIHSENKQGTGPTYKGGFGFHPLLCFADETGEALAAMLRPGNAGANTVTDHLNVLDAAVAQLPARIAAGHHHGDHGSLVERGVQVRTDSAGCTCGFVHGCRARNIGFAVVARSNASIHAAISRITTITDPRWQPARRASGDTAIRSDVAEVTDLCDLSDWPTGTWMIVRREHLHPGAQRRLVPVHHVPLLGSLHRQHRHPSRTRRAHACSRTRRRPHQTTQGLRAGTVPVQRPRRQPGLAPPRVHQRQSRPLVPATVLHRPAQDR